MKQVEDAEILEKFTVEKTRQEAFNLLLNKYQQKIYWHVRRMVVNHDDTDDLVQDVFIKVWKNLDHFRNDSITFLNKQKQKNNTPLDEVSSELAESLIEPSYFNGNDIQLKLQRAILTLPEKQRLIFNMKYFDDLKYEEISQILGTTVGALKASFHIAVKKIEAFMLNDNISF
jgi:RNA polymerase sigma factor (sigma-70 family)